jgi:hypothetical protein
VKRAKRGRRPAAAATQIGVDAAKRHRQEHDEDFLRIAREVMKKHDRVFRALASEADQLPPDDANGKM